MNTWTMAMPGALRMRSLYPLLEGDACAAWSTIWSGAVVLDVPGSAAPCRIGARNRRIDDGLLDWMIAEDLGPG